MEKVTTDTILNWVKERVENKKVVSREDWIEIAFKLNTLLLDEVETLFSMKQYLAQKRKEIFEKQEGKRNVSAAELEVETLDEYRKMRIQEAKCDQIREFIMIAKKNSDNF